MEYPRQRQKMEPHNHRAPVGGKVGTMDSMREDRKHGNGEELDEREQQELPPDLRGDDCRGVLLAEQATFSKDVNRGSEQQQRRKSKGGPSESVEGLGLPQTPSQPTRPKHGFNQGPAPRTENSLRLRRQGLRRQVGAIAFDRDAAVQVGFLRVMLTTP